MHDLPNKAPPQAIVQVVEPIEAVTSTEVTEPVVKSLEVANQAVESNEVLTSTEVTEPVVKSPEVAKFDEKPDWQFCSEEDRENINEIITTLAENGKVKLLFKQNHLKELGAQIDHLHPLKLLSTIFTNPELKSHMTGIFNDYFKRNGFMDGIGPSLDSKADAGDLNQYIEKFAQEVNVPSENIKPFFENKDWEGLIEYLIND